MPRTPLETVIDALAARGQKPRGNDQGWTALCPAHEDSTPSLSIGVGQDGRALIHCHAGCHLTDILNALQLTNHALFTEPNPNGAEITATYDYVDEAGLLLYQVVRKPGKRFLQRRPDGNGGWIWNLRNTRRVLYRLPQVLDAQHVFIVEGEKDADRLHADRLVATCNPHGAGKWRPEYNDALKGADVIIVADKDPAGREHARHIAQQLNGIANTIRTVEAAAGKDISDHYVAGHTIEQLVPIDLEQPDEPSYFVDPELDEFLDTQDPDYDWLVEGLIERQDRIILTGEEGRGKSTLLRQIAIQLASGIHPFTLQPIPPLQVLLVDCENSARQVRRKLRAIRQPAATYTPGRLRLRILGHALELAHQEIQDDIAVRIETQQVDVLIVGPLYKLIDDDPNKEVPARAVADALDRLRQIRGTALIIEAHSPYAEGSRSKRPIRPYGASLWSRWPEFGIYLGELGELKHWRGQREERAWPPKLRHDQPWPWAIDTEPLTAWDGPTICADAIVEFLKRSGAWAKQAEIKEMFKANSQGHSNDTIKASLEIALHDGRLRHRKGPNRSNWFQTTSVPESSPPFLGNTGEDE